MLEGVFGQVAITGHYVIADAANRSGLSGKLEPAKAPVCIGRVQLEYGVVKVIYHRPSQSHYQALDRRRSRNAGGAMNEDRVVSSRSNRIPETTQEAAQVCNGFRSLAPWLVQHRHQVIIGKGYQIDFNALRFQIRHPLLDSKSLAWAGARRIWNQCAYGNPCIGTPRILYHDFPSSDARTVTSEPALFELSSPYNLNWRSQAGSKA